jgi:hypothetical protein
MHETAFILSGVLAGLSIGLAIGYVGYKITGGTLNFHGWLANEYYGHPVGVLIWAIGGALVAVTATYFKYKL